MREAGRESEGEAQRAPLHWQRRRESSADSEQDLRRQRARGRQREGRGKGGGGEGGGGPSDALSGASMAVRRLLPHFECTEPYRSLGDRPPSPRSEEKNHVRTWSQIWGAEITPQILPLV